MQLSFQLNVIWMEKPTWSYPAKIFDCIRLLFRRNWHQNPLHRLCCSLLCKTNDKNVKNQFAVLNAILEVKKIKLSILRINSILGRQTNNREKKHCYKQLYIEWHASWRIPIYIFSHCEEKLREDNKKNWGYDNLVLKTEFTVKWLNLGF